MVLLKKVLLQREDLHNNINKTNMEVRVTSSVSPSRKRTASSSSSREKSDSTLTSDSVDRDESIPERSHTDIPPDTSQWTENHLSSLGVEVVSCSTFSPVTIMESVFQGAVHVLNYHKIEAKQFKQEILTNPPKGWENLKNYKSISDILETDLVKLESEITDLNKLDPEKDKAIEDSTWLPHQMTFLPTKWFTTSRLHHCRFYLMGEQFGRYLLHMAETKQHGEMITEKMYEKLFDLFLGMFGLLGNPAPTARNIQIRSGSVVSVPDITISRAEKMLAVIKIKKRFKKKCGEDMEPPKKAHRLSTESDGRQNMDHLDKHIVGQTGGDLLVHLKATASSEKKILGIIVQETFVTFTYLEEREEFENKDGHYIMKFSKPYNYLDPEEREDLMEPLILLSLLQNNPKFLLL